MASRSKLPALLLIVLLPVLACQIFQPAQMSCRVNMPEIGWVSHRNGDQVTFKVDAMDWIARVDCSSGQLVDGQPVRPERAREMFIPVQGSTYRLLTSDPSVTMAEHHENGSQVRIEAAGTYYLVVLSAAPGAQGEALVSYFMGGQSENGVVRLYCYNRTDGDAHSSRSGLAAMWAVAQPSTVSLVCSGRNFVLEVSTEITAAILKQGPAPTPIVPVPLIIPEPPGSHL